MYASGSAPAATREPYAAFKPAAGPASGDGAQFSPARAALAPDVDSITAPPGQIADGAGSVPGSPMAGILAVFGDFLRAAFEQLGQMLAGLVAGSQAGTGVSSGNGSGNGPASFQAAQADPSDGADSDPSAGGAQSVSPSSDAGDPAVADPQGPQAGVGALNEPGAQPAKVHRHGHAHAHAHRGARGSNGNQGPLRPGQSLDLGQGESVTRTRDGALQITIGANAAQSFAAPASSFGGTAPSFGSAPSADADSSLMPGGLL